MLFDTLVSFRKTTLVDYPGKLAAAIFFPFCNMRCPWCHNGALLNGEERRSLIPLDDALAVITKRKAVLGGVVLSGGEPTLYPKLIELIAEIKKLSLSVKLDTNGSNPEVIKKILSSKDSFPDFIALDLKIAPARYAELLPPSSSERKIIAGKIRESAKIIRESGLSCEMRSIALPGGTFGSADIDALAPLVGGAPWYFRVFRPGGCLDPSWNDFSPVPAQEAESLAACAKSFGKNAFTE